MMLFQIEESDRFESAYADLLERIQNALQQTYHEEQEAHGLTKTAIADVLDVDLSVVSRRLNGAGNITLRTISDMYTAMNREPLSNFVPPRTPVGEKDKSDRNPVDVRAKCEPVSMEYETQSGESVRMFESQKPFMVENRITNIETLCPGSAGSSGTQIRVLAAA